MSRYLKHVGLQGLPLCAWCLVGCISALGSAFPLHSSGGSCFLAAAFPEIGKNDKWGVNDYLMLPSSHPWQRPPHLIPTGASRGRQDNVGNALCTSMHGGTKHPHEMWCPVGFSWFSTRLKASGNDGRGTPWMLSQKRVIHVGVYESLRFPLVFVTFSLSGWPFPAGAHHGDSFGCTQ